MGGVARRFLLEDPVGWRKSGHSQPKSIENQLLLFLSWKFGSLISLLPFFAPFPLSLSESGRKATKYTHQVFYLSFYDF